jgi:hypothetical protein
MVPFMLSFISVPACVLRCTTFDHVTLKQQAASHAAFTGQNNTELLKISFIHAVAIMPLSHAVIYLAPHVLRCTYQASGSLAAGGSRAPA